MVSNFMLQYAFLHMLATRGPDVLSLQHGYLISQFLSPRVNKRTDQYGSDTLENRSRIVFEIIEAIKEKVTDKSCMPTPYYILDLTANKSCSHHCPQDQLGRLRGRCVSLERWRIENNSLAGDTSF